MKHSYSSTSIEINGVKYNSPEEVPAEFKKFFTDDDANGTPDFIDSTLADALDKKNTEKKSSVSFKSNFNINGKNYDSLQDIPEVATFLKAFKIGLPKTATPTASQKTIGQDTMQTSDNQSAPNQPLQLPNQQATAPQEERTPLITQLVVFTILVVLIGLYFFSR